MTGSKTPPQGGKRWMVTPAQTLAVARREGMGEEELGLGEIAVLTFSQGVGERLEVLCGLKDAEWISQRHHPYAAPRLVKRGNFQGMGIILLVPPMGASPLACLVEDLAACGVRAVFLVCAAWSLGPPVRFGDLILPSFSVGHDGTSIHYGNDAGHIDADGAVVDVLTAACRDLGATTHVGGNGSCEALYRITPEMMENFRAQGCLCMENGEASTLFAVAQTLGIYGGVLFQPYIDLERGWDPAYLADERYTATCHLQAEAVLEAGLRLQRKGWV